MEGDKVLFREEVFAIIGCAIEVHKELGPGFLEAVYHEAFEIVLREKGIPYKSKARLKIAFRGKTLKKAYESDFICHDSIVVEIKAQSRLLSVDQAQLLNYIKAAKVRLGLLINFGSYPTLEWKRFVK